MASGIVGKCPALSPAELAFRFVPARRFAAVSFESFVPDPREPSQAAALTTLRGLLDRLGAKRSPARAGDYCYLDGPFGVGKTHLLAALWHSTSVEKAYLSFSELCAYIGYVGMAAAVDELGSRRLLCIDEFELDDVANTMMAVTSLRSIGAGGCLIATTSNTLPDDLGKGRFGVQDFRREVALIASLFTVVQIDGDDFRRRTNTSRDERGKPADHPAQPTVVEFDALLVHLSLLHPVYYGALVEDLHSLRIDRITTIRDQAEALRFVVLVDELYEHAVITNVGNLPDPLFDESFRLGGYRKKYARCESRLVEMLAEVAT